ncbi:MAG: hypothetical protein MMC33_010168 [Icmadophila ericetorum]|nr:hypothetical protein [Icmadophila ericetorum]
MASSKGAALTSLQPPHFTINLSLPPQQRYTHLVSTFASEFSTLPSLFDDLILSVRPSISMPLVRNFARLFLRRAYTLEETAELRGIQKATGIEMYLLVAFNVLLDLLMGCTSGGVRVRDADGVWSEETRMLHFRTLDWGMEPLRKLIVNLDFVEREGGLVIASTITYFGFVGVLTGVKPGLSMSLNFRPGHDASTNWNNWKFYGHHLMVLFGFRPAICSVLRQCLLPSKRKLDGITYPATLETLERDIPPLPSTAAYLIFSNGSRTITIEKDNRSAFLASSEDFIVALNHDVGDEPPPKKPKSKATTHQSTTKEYTKSETLKKTGMDDLVKYSITRKKCVVGLWTQATSPKELSASRRREAARSDIEIAGTNNNSEPPSVSMSTLERWMDSEAITNEETHFACVMDPKVGRVVWIKRYVEPVSGKAL